VENNLRGCGKAGHERREVACQFRYLPGKHDTCYRLSLHSANDLFVMCLTSETWK